jgi:mRNA interferase RelE/StbE
VTVTWSERAVGTASRYLVDDRPGLSAVMDAVDRLAHEPEPPEAVRVRATPIHRLLVGRYRVLYELGEDEITVIHVGRVG